MNNHVFVSYFTNMAQIHFFLIHVTFIDRNQVSSGTNSTYESDHLETPRAVYVSFANVIVGDVLVDDIGALPTDLGFYIKDISTFI